MTYRYLTAGTALASALLVASAAAAMPGTASGDVNMRSGPGTQYSVITTIPAGAPLEVFDCQNWCEVAYAGTQGYVSARYVSGGDYVQPAPRAYYRAPPTVYVEPALPPPVYYRDRYWDDGYSYWGDDRRWRDRGGPGFGISFGF